MSTRTPRLAGLLFAALAAVLVTVATPANGDSALLTHGGVLYEVFPAQYVDVVPSAAGTSDARLPVLALRTTRPGAAPVLELVDGTVTPEEKGAPSLGYDEITDTLFVVYMRFQGLMTDVQFAARRQGAWREQSILPSAGLYLSLNPQLVVTRQTYTDLDANGAPVTKSRSVVSIVWWEEGGRSQARYAPVFVEDGQLQVGEITPYNLNELAGAAGDTNVDGLPFSSYQFPAVQRDPAGNGGVLVSFANMATKRQSVLRIGFPDSLPAIIASGVPAGIQASARLHMPIGRGGNDGPLPVRIDIAGSVGTVIAPTSLVPTFYWSQDDGVHVFPDDAPDGTPDTVIPLRPDFTLDRAVSVVRDMALGN